MGGAHKRAVRRQDAGGGGREGGRIGREAPRDLGFANEKIEPPSVDVDQDGVTVPHGGQRPAHA